MPKKTIKSVEAEFAQYKAEVNSFLDKLRARRPQPHFGVVPYTGTGSDKKPNAVNVPELCAIQLTASKLGYDVIIHPDIVNGEVKSLQFSFIEKVPYIPSALLF